MDRLLHDRPLQRPLAGASGSGRPLVLTRGCAPRATEGVRGRRRRRAIDARAVTARQVHGLADCATVDVAFGKYRLRSRGRCAVVIMVGARARSVSVPMAVARSRAQAGVGIDQAGHRSRGTAKVPLELQDDVGSTGQYLGGEVLNA